jgi:hypothetical protein
MPNRVVWLKRLTQPGAHPSLIKGPRDVEHVAGFVNCCPVPYVDKKGQVRQQGAQFGAGLK